MNTDTPQTPQLPQNAVKCRFFALYLNLRNSIYRRGFLNRDNTNPNGIDEYDSLELKPLSKITKKDLEKIGFENIGDKKISFVFDNYNYSWTSSCGKNGTLILKDIDYLRSKGYAVPFMEYSLNELVELGWVRLV
jgi:hypothetical protein